MGRRFNVNDTVDTPKGSGVVQGYTILGDDALRVLVRVSVPGERDPRCTTPRATSSSLWAFRESEVRRRKR